MGFADSTTMISPFEKPLRHLLNSGYVYVRLSHQFLSEILKLLVV